MEKNQKAVIRMTDTERLAEEYGIITRWENGNAFFSGNFRNVVMTRKYREVSKLMKAIEENERPSRCQPIVVEARRCLLVLYPDEIFNLTSNDPALFEKALRRGKSELRMRSAEQRANDEEGSNV